MNLPHIPGYEFEELIGEGGCGAVYRCRHQEGDYRAVKILNGLAINAGLLSHSLTTTAGLDHPGLVPIYTYNLSQAPYFYTTHYFGVDGRGAPATMEALMGKLRPDKAWRLIEQLIDALAFLHKNDLVHTSVKPSNIFIEQDDEGIGFRLKLSDFGQGLVGGLHYYEMGRSGFYASPEQLANGDFSHGKGKRWDVYSFGVVAFQLLTGQLPRLGDRYRKYLSDQRKRNRNNPNSVFQQENPAEVVEDLQKEPVVTWPTKPKNEYEARLRDVVDRCLDLEPTNRPVDLREVARTFENIRHEADLQSVKDQHKAQIRGKTIKIRTLLGTTGIFLLSSMLLLVGAIIGFAKFGVEATKVLQEDARRRAELAKQKSAYEGIIANEKSMRIEAEETKVTEVSAAEAKMRDARGMLTFSHANADRFFDMILLAKDVDFEDFQPVRRERMKEALVYFEDFRRKYANDPGFKSEVARAHQFVGEIKKSQGRLSEAIQDLVLARNAFDALEVSTSEKARLIGETALIERSIAEMELLRGNADGAEVALDRSSERFRKQISHSGGENERASFELVQNRLISTEIKREREDFGGALRELGIIADSLVDLRAKNPNSDDYKYLLGKAFCDIGYLLRKDKKKPDAARQMYQNAKEFFAQLVVSNDQIEDYQYYLAVCLNQEGEITQDKSKVLGALELLNRIVSLNPNDHRYRFELAYNYGRLAEMQRDEGQPEEAFKLNKMAIAEFEKLVAKEPGIRRYNFNLARQQAELAQVLTDREAFKEAAAIFDESVATISGLLEKEPTNERYLTVIAKSLGNAGYVWEKLGDKKKAKSLYALAKDAWGKVLKLQPKDLEASSGQEWTMSQLKRIK
tara:strand:+ start:7837 stop:10407 length:2571 start_codon:yes stop_codon:yes gene_type:complete